MKTMSNPIHSCARVKTPPPVSAVFSASAGQKRQRTGAVQNLADLPPWILEKRPLVLQVALLGLLAALCCGVPRAHGSGGTLVSWGSDDNGQVSGTPTTGTFSAV